MIAINKLLQETANNPSPKFEEAFSIQKVVEKLNIKNAINEKRKIQNTDLFFLYKSCSIKNKGTNEKKIKKIKNEQIVGQLRKKNKPEKREYIKYFII